MGILVILGILLFYFVGYKVVFNRDFAPVVYAKDGTILAASVAKDGQWRIYCADKIPDKLATCIRLFEDRYFYYHPGVNPVALLEAARDNYKAGHIVRGGSTLTMQLARLYYHHSKRTYWQKLKEILLAFGLEMRYSKKEILQLYGQYAPFGGNIIGYEAASRLYYGKAPEALSWGESALLAVLPNAPSNIYPGKGQATLIRKRDSLLKRLLEHGWIDSLGYHLALKEGVPTRKHRFPGLAPHLLSYFKQSGNNTFNKFRTTLDPFLQSKTVQTVQQFANRYSGQGIDNLAVLVMRSSGSIAAYVANSNCSSEQCGSHVDIIRSLRSPGSILKPFLYGCCLDAGFITTKSLLKDIPVFYNGFSPKNYDHKFRGIVPAKEALTRSLNVPAVNLFYRYGVDAFLEDLHGVGMRHLDQKADHYGLSLILGGCEVTMLEVATAYTNLLRTAEKKTSIRPHILQSSSDSSVMESFPISAAACSQILDILQGVNRPSSRNGWQYFVHQKPISWKTGTSYGYRDAWAAGVTKEYTVVVWVGNADGEGRKGLTGIDKAAPVLFSIFDLLPATSEVSKPYNEYKEKRICSSSGFAASPSCPKTEMTYVPEHAGPLPICTFHCKLYVDATETYRIKKPCNRYIPSHERSYFILDPIVDSYYKKYTGQSYSLPPIHPDCNTGESQRLHIIYPPPYADILLPKDVDESVKKLVCVAAASESVDSLYWFVDGDIVQVNRKPFKLELELAEGKHNLTVVTPDGSSVTHYFKIRQ